MDLIKLYPDHLFVANFATHEKLLTVDEKIAVIGSANWLSNRRYTNSECSVIITNEAYAKSASKRAIESVKQNRIVVDIPKPKRRAKVSINETELNAQDRDLLLKLKKVRITLAREKSVAAFVIFSDAVLIDMALKRPNTREKMLAISGVGEVKFERYGSYFMELIAGV